MTVHIKPMHVLFATMLLATVCSNTSASVGTSDPKQTDPLELAGTENHRQ